MERFILDPGLARDACDRLGVALPSDLDGVADLYRAWCASVPFDPIAKALALRRSETPPGAEPADLLLRWLDRGVGGTCWGHCSSLAGILEVAGVRATVGLDRMVRVDGVVDFHSFVVVGGGGRRLALDPIHVSGAPLVLEPGSRGDHGAYETWLEDDEGRLLHRLCHPASPEVTTYHVLALDLDADDVRAFCEVSALHSGVRAQRLFARRCPPGELVQLRTEDDGSLTLHRWTAEDHTVEAVDPSGGVPALGWGAEALAMAAAAGLLQS